MTRTAVGSSSTSPPLCIFCFKNGTDCGNSSKGKDQEEAVLYKFFKMVHRYFEEKPGLRTNRKSSSETFPFLPVVKKLNGGTCPECFAVIEKYCKVYHKIKCLELEMIKLLDTLKGNIKCGDDDSARVNHFISCCLTEKGKLEKVMELRKMFTKHCDERTFGCFPKISLADQKTLTVKHPLANKDAIIPLSDCEINAILPTVLEDMGLSSEPASDDDTPHSAISVIEAPPRRVTRPKTTRTYYPAIIDASNIKQSPYHQMEDEVEVEIDWNIGIPKYDNDDDADWVADIDVLSNIGDADYESDIVSDAVDPIDSPPEAEEDSDWGSDFDNRKRKKRQPERQRKRIRTRASRAKSKNLRSSAKNMAPVSCNKCEIEPPPVFSTLEALQIHQNYLHTDGYVTLSKSDNTEVLHLEKKDLKLKGVDTAIFRCEYSEVCTREFMLQQELNNHLNYHADVACDKCHVVMTNAVDMTKHEIEKHVTKDSETGFLACRKCSYSTPMEGEMINHNLEMHMDKPKIETTCPICKDQFNYLDEVPFLHYLNYHDLSRLEDPSSTGIDCTHDNCLAYFLTEDQLQQHWNSSHGGGGKAPTVEYSKQKRQDSKLHTLAVKRRRKRIKYQNREYEHKCQYCTKKFRAEHELSGHVWNNHADLKYGAPCGEIQLTDVGLTIDEFCTDDNCVCEICKKVFSSEEQLTRHRAHHGEFKCNFCQVVKTLASEMAIHEIVHNIQQNKKSSVGTLSCPRCAFSTNCKKRQDYIDHHLETHMGVPSDRRRCPICCKPFPNMAKMGLNGPKNWLIPHYMENHDKTGLDPDTMPKCTLCPGYFRTSIQLHTHSREVHGKQTALECVDCGKIFGKRDRLQRHRRILHQVDESTFQFCCTFPECDRRFERQIELDFHENNAHKEKNVGVLVCTLCSKKVVGTGQLKSHMLTHEDKERKVVKGEPEEPGVCDQCGKSFRTKRSLRDHMTRHLGPDVWEFQCQICSKKTPTSSKLSRHMLVHTKKELPEGYEIDLQLPCAECGKVFSSRRQLYAHSMTHYPEDYRFQCEQCPKKFISNHKLKRHMECHKEKKPKEKAKVEDVKTEWLECPVEGCGKTFKKAKYLREHIKRHDGPEGWRFTCSICSKPCPTKFKMNEHMLTHTNEKPFKCRVCGKAYGHEQSLQVHMMKEHDGLELLSGEIGEKSN